jgi:type I restriction enzyme M protein
LFTDYIAEHLNSNGRAGIVVPNGIVATSQTAYKQLRKMLVQDSLIAVISLPAGVFQPYSGVKTSVLILDKRLSKKSQHILFLKIENDGFDLGAQRREIDKNDLPTALAFLETYKNCLNQMSESGFTGLKDIQDLQVAYEQNPANPKIDKILLQTIATLVEKEIVLGNKDVVLSAERYFETVKSQTEFELVKIGEVAKLVGGSTPSKENSSYWEQGDVDWITCSDFSSNQMYIEDSIRKITEKAVKENSTSIIPKDTLVLVTRVSLGKMSFVRKPTALNQDLTAIIFDEKKINKLYGYYFLISIADKIVKAGHGATVKGVTRDFIKELEIPLPPLEIQQQIVAEIEGYQKIIDGAKQIVNNYKPTITINPDWEMVELGTLAKNLDGKRKPVTKGDRTEGQYPYYGASGIVDYVEDYIFDDTLLLISEDGANLVSRVYPIAFTATGKYWVNNHAHVLKFNSPDLHRYVEVFINQIDISKHVTGAAQPKLNQSHLNEILIPIPSFEEQQTIVKAIEEEMQLVNGNKRLIEIFEQKIKTKIGEVWGVKEEIETV